jgi:hypothetical protein
LITAADPAYTAHATQVDCDEEQLLLSVWYRRVCSDAQVLTLILCLFDRQSHPSDLNSRPIWK